ncbi:MAG: hypothetical protein JOZ62_19420, partial [Acidobacteriaceae bacterium]|nr:hypothetical protein [Acidobacteriaceae bacterium]
AISVTTGVPYNGPQINTATNSVSATVNGTTGQVVSAGLAQSLSGIYWVYVIMPSNVQTSAQTPIYIAQNAFISNTVTIPTAGGSSGGSGGATLTLNPNPISSSNGLGQTTISWNCSQCTSAEVHVGSPSGPLFSAGGSTGTATTGDWVVDGTVFYLQNASNGNATDSSNTVATATAQVQQSSDPPPSSGTPPTSTSVGGATISLNPNPMNAPGGFGQTTVSWNCSQCRTAEVHVGSPSGALFSAGGSTGTATTGVWVIDGTVFYLQNTSNGNPTSSANTVATISAQVQSGSTSSPPSNSPSGSGSSPSSPPPSTSVGGATISANPNPIASAQGGLGQTTVSWNCPQCTRAEVHVGSPSGVLFSAGGSTGSATTGVWVTDGTVFYLQNASSGTATSSANTVATITVQVQSGSSSPSARGTISASPNPITSASGGLGQTRLSWTCSSCSRTQVRLGSPGGALFSAGGSSGTETTGVWVTDGMVFYLQDA